MQDLITSFIIQAKECKLRDIGKFEVVTTSAEADIASKQITPPRIEIIFTRREEKISDGLVKYVSQKKKITVAEALDDLKKWCADSKYKLKNGEEILLEPLGIIKKEPSGNVFLPSKNTIYFFEPVFAERVIHQNRETTSSIMNHFYHEEVSETKSNAWKIFAVILLTIGLFFLFVHFYKNSFSLTTIGNQHKVIPYTPPKTYTTP
jgi:nucleoid DNA-binding protein